MLFSILSIFAIFCHSKNSQDKMDKAIRLRSSKKDDYNAALHTLCYFLKHTHHLIIQDISSVTSASTCCHSTAASGLYTAAACLCSTLYSLDKSAAPYTVWGGFKSARKRGEWGIVILSTSTITPSQTQRFKLTHLAFNPAGKCNRGGWNVRAGDEGRIEIKEQADNTSLWYRG